MEKWDNVYAKQFGGTWYPNENVVKFAAHYLQRRIDVDSYETKRKIEKVLDAGCGNGRHVVFFAEQGYDVSGVDISGQAINVAQVWLAQKKLKADLKVNDIEKLPYQNKYFDMVLSCEMLDHVPFSKAKEIVQEIKRVLKPKGYFFLSLRSTESSECGQGEKIAENTFILQEGYEKGLMQHFFNLEEAGELLKEFKIFDIELYEQKFPDLFTIDKAFLQSSQGIKKSLDLSKPLDLNLKNSRWYFAAEKV